MKGQVRERTQSSLDLYLKQTFVRPVMSPRDWEGDRGATGGGDKEAGLFRPHLSEYNAMEEFRMYPLCWEVRVHTEGAGPGTPPP